MKQAFNINLLQHILDLNKKDNYISHKAALAYALGFSIQRNYEKTIDYIKSCEVPYVDILNEVNLALNELPVVFATYMSEKGEFSSNDIKSWLIEDFKTSLSFHLKDKEVIKRYKI